MNLILLHKEDLLIKENEAFAVLKGREHTHCQQVLKLKVGSRVKVGVTGAATGEAEVVACKPQQTELKLLSRIDLNPAKAPWEHVEIDLLLAMPRPKVLERMLQLCAVVGVRRVFLVCAGRTEKGFLCSSRLAVENILEQFKLGLEQGMLTQPPELHAFASWEGFLAATAAAEEAAAAPTAEAEAATELPTESSAWLHYLLPPLRLVAHPHAEPTLPQLLLRPFSTATSSSQLQQQQQQQQQQQERAGVLLAVGPEGGWIPPEMNLLQQQLRCLPFRLTDKVLKCETALTACLTQLTMCYEDPMFLPLLRSPGEVYAAAAAAAAAASGTANDATAAAATGNGEDQTATQKREAHKRQGGREVVRAIGGFLMTFPLRYETRRNAADKQPEQQQQQRQREQQEQQEHV
ncbi:RNA methyltransferase, RsmE family protein, related [Eimeria necatrix]|uniref:16S rRNA (uracil(1498)-N(3))-methyltransferase n=1 Tax=Eimeria necatrix TaxID=51315 RepID=U6MZW4_9EIME|nr:RNA methyltransferase, RsmE family protein, related [Eimeria necatrix]CDJ68019.1 RNA methyltransferase, RsmE family protein, related [Eimeria necatrix]